MFEDDVVDSVNEDTKFWFAQRGCTGLDIKFGDKRLRLTTESATQLVCGV